jgi:hypothetical protein
VWSVRGRPKRRASCSGKRVALVASVHTLDLDLQVRLCQEVWQHDGDQDAVGAGRTLAFQGVV